jgi:Protein of unknown function (DUF4197)
MFKKLAFVPLLLVFASCAELQKVASTVLTEPTSLDIGNGLKEALNVGISKGVDVLSAKDGFYKSAYKILLPEEARNVTNKLKNIPGFSNVEEILLEKINRGAEDASVRAKPIFISAIKKMTFSDATNILMGSDNAATSFLQKATTDDVYKEFNPVIVASLDKFDARKYWSDAVNAYNKIPLVKKANADLDDYVTRQAMKGLFSMVEVKEKDIRRNKLSRSSELLKKVFAKQDASRK